MNYYCRWRRGAFYRYWELSFEYLRLWAGVGGAMVPGVGHGLVRRGRQRALGRRGFGGGTSFNSLFGGSD